jgi:hypothetical protein
VTTSLKTLIDEPEPLALKSLHFIKVALCCAAFALLPIGLVAALIGYPNKTWLHAFFGLFTAAIIIAWVANYLSAHSFARRAQALGINKDEAIDFWRNYDWEVKVA